LEARGIAKSLNQQKANSSGKLVSLRRRPTVNILKQSGQSRFFKRTLKIFVTERKEDEKNEHRDQKTTDRLISLLMTST
jgi:hypothetical protein